MKKLLYSVAILATGIFASACNDTDLGGPKDPVEMMATEALAGEWYVHMDGVDASGNVTMEDPFGVGTFELLTYNTAANVPTEMFIDDLENFWGMKGIVKCDVNNLTFSATAAQELYNDITFDIIDGKVLIKAATSSYGHQVDSITFLVKYSDDDYIGEYWDAMRISGYRRTGFDEGRD
ncbi:MAG: hypothetical protein HUJ97_01900 [Bacteroidales bacterium]|nr:hypothetical protein [Bacteroidales bacterium]